MENNEEWKELCPDLVPFVRENKHTITLPKDLFNEFIKGIFIELQEKHSSDEQDLTIKQLYCLSNIIGAEDGETFNGRAHELIIAKLGEILNKMK